MCTNVIRWHGVDLYWYPPYWVAIYTPFKLNTDFITRLHSTCRSVICHSKCQIQIFISQGTYGPYNSTFWFHVIFSLDKHISSNRHHRWDPIIHSIYLLLWQAGVVHQHLWAVLYSGVQFGWTVLREPSIYGTSICQRYRLCQCRASGCMEQCRLQAEPRLGRLAAD